MSDKAECPGCRAYSSSVIADTLNGDPCRFCGLSPNARAEILGIRAKKANQDVTERCEALIKHNSELQEEIDNLRRRLDRISVAVLDTR